MRATGFVLEFRRPLALRVVSCDLQPPPPLRPAAIGHPHHPPLRIGCYGLWATTCHGPDLKPKEGVSCIIPPCHPAHEK
jgi:hypothetical protein